MASLDGTPKKSKSRKQIAEKMVKKTMTESYVSNTRQQIGLKDIQTNTNKQTT